ncbi:MAG: type IX secretion system sortase PorU [Bacteroidales bacterium]|nr:type IX secretion system sortase PorU [Bacteroidales bacterium]
MKIFHSIITKILFSIIFIANCHLIGNAQSALHSGNWIKVSISESGVYKITYEDLQNWGFTDISQIAIFGNGAKELPLLNGTEMPDTLHEIAIFTHFGSDGIFNAGDYILFYGQSPQTWEYTNNTFSHKTHSYSDENYYFITCNRKTTKFIENKENIAATTPIEITSYDGLYFYEQDASNFIRSGRNFMESFSSPKTISFSVPNIQTNETATITTAVAARHSATTSITISANNTTVGTISYYATTSNKPYAYLKEKSFTYKPTSSTVNITITPNFSGANSRGIIDNCEFVCRCKLQVNNNEQIIFRDSKSIGNDNVGKFKLQSNSECSVWSITNPEHPVRLSTQYSNGYTTFTDSSNTLQEYIAFSSKFKSVKFEKKIENQNIVSATDADMIIIANDIFAPYAQQIADMHKTKDNFNTTIVSQEAICNEFSSGRKDVAAIRNYLRYIYKKGNKKLQYVLLFGDGTYNNKSIALNGTNIFTLQSKESLDLDNSYCSDDFFAILGDNKGLNGDKFVGETDIAIGRFAVSNEEEAKIVVNKNIQYALNQSFRGDWQNNLCFLADDADDNQTIHMTDADELCRTIAKNYPFFNFDKIYADAYQQEKNSAGQRYPEVINAIRDRMQKGCLIFNYTGHGNENRMMAEYSVDANSIETWKNQDKLPLFIGAACNVAHFDQDWISLGEKIVSLPKGGGIAMISATRYSYASSNYTFCNNLYKTIFTLDSLNQIRTIGETLKIAKGNTANDFYQNKRLYTLLGDPALRLAIPLYSIAVDSINGKEVQSIPDTIKAHSIIHIAGHIETVDGSTATEYEGTLSIKLFDKEQSITTLGNDGNDTFTYKSYTNVLFQGQASIQKGQFSFSAPIPEDIFYYEGKGKLSLYANNDTTQATGAYNNFIINGSENAIDDDFTGPSISLYLNDTTFTDGAMTNQNPTLLAFITDTSGINISNASFGHNITITIDGDESSQIELNNFYYSDLNSFFSGTIQYKLQNLEEGPHTLTLSVWDSYNNNTETSLSFYVCNSKQVVLKNLYNYPNPMQGYTNFHFEHNQTEEESTITLKIFDGSGNLVYKMSKTGTIASFQNTNISWNGKSSNGTNLKSGIYPYTIEIKTSNGKTLVGEQKILLVR